MNPYPDPFKSRCAFRLTCWGGGEGKLGYRVRGRVWVGFVTAEPYKGKCKDARGKRISGP